MDKNTKDQALRAVGQAELQLQIVCDNLGEHFPNMMRALRATAVLRQNIENRVPEDVERDRRHEEASQDSPRRVPNQRSRRT